VVSKLSISQKKLSKYSLGLLYNTKRSNKVAASTFNVSSMCRTVEKCNIF